MCCLAQRVAAQGEDKPIVAGRKHCLLLVVSCVSALTASIRLWRRHVSRRNRNIFSLPLTHELNLEMFLLVLASVGVSAP